MRQRILLIVLGVVILLAIYTFFIRPKPQVVQRVAKAKSQTAAKVSKTKEKVAAATKEVAKTVAQPVKSLIETKTETIKTEPISENGKWGSDPFIRDWVSSEEIKDLRLKAVTQSGSKAYALINDQILETGEMIQGKRIVAIDKDNVTLEQGDRKFVLFLGQ